MKIQRKNVLLIKIRVIIWLRTRKYCVNIYKVLADAFSEKD